MMSYDNIRNEVLMYLDESANQFDVDCIVSDIMDRGADSIYDIDPDELTDIMEFWAAA